MEMPAWESSLDTQSDADELCGFCPLIVYVGLVVSAPFL